ncbi:MAG: hypothetical protein K8T25_09365 [Planctomycetia bacterium]|nr:hypothetical protein [Planctomycetia bacterium]
MAITAETPMIMPSDVSAERIRLRRNAPSAVRSVGGSSALNGTPGTGWAASPSTGASRTGWATATLCAACETLGPAALEDAVAPLCDTPAASAAWPASTPAEDDADAAPASTGNGSPSMRPPCGASGCPAVPLPLDAACPLCESCPFTGPLTGAWPFVGAGVGVAYTVVGTPSSAGTDSARTSSPAIKPSATWIVRSA